MRLREVHFRRFRQFIDQRLTVDPRVTVIVGRNDSGKTSVLNRFFDQYVYEAVIHSFDRPQIPGYEGHISFALDWEIESKDLAHRPLGQILEPDARSLRMEFEQHEGVEEDWAYYIDGHHLSPFDKVPSTGRPSFRPGLEPRQLLPMPHYIRIGEDRLLPSQFEARFYDLTEATVEAEKKALYHMLPLEALFLRLAGIRAETRRSSGSGVEESWPSATGWMRTNMRWQDVDLKLRALSKRVTGILAEWWHDPPGLTFEARVPGNDSAKEYMQRLNSHLIVWEARDEAGTSYWGAGLLWFIAFAVELIYASDQQQPMLLLFDEPATPLHPAGQRAVATLLDRLSSSHQLVYSTHSPFADQLELSAESTAIHKRLLQQAQFHSKQAVP